MTRSLNELGEQIDGALNAITDLLVETGRPGPKVSAAIDETVEHLRRYMHNRAEMRDLASVPELYRGGLPSLEQSQSVKLALRPEVV